MTSPRRSLTTKVSPSRMLTVSEAIYPPRGSIGTRKPAADADVRGGLGTVREALVVVRGEPAEERLERLAFIVGQRRQELLLEAPDHSTKLRQGLLPGRCELDEMASAVVWIAAPLDKATLLDLVE